MTDLLELTQIMDGYKLRQIEVLTRPLRPGVQESRYRQMYHALANGEIHTEEEAAQLLGLDVKGRPFRRFLLEFRRRLYAPLLFLDTENSEQFNATQKANFECLRKLGIFQTLLHRKCLINAAMLAAEIVEIAAQNDVTLVALEMATYLKRYFVEQEPDPDKYRYYKAYVDRFRFDWEAENKALAGFYRLVAPSVKKKSALGEISDKAIEMANSLSIFADRCNTILFIAGYYGVQLAQKMSIYSWKASINICDIALEKLGQKKCFSPRIKGFFYTNKVSCLLMLEKYNEALELNHESFRKEIEGTRDWFTYLESHIMVALKGGFYEIALETFVKVNSNPKFKLLPELMHETWHLYLAYLALASRMQPHSSSQQNEEVLQNFKLKKFINQVPISSKDKKGLNIPILIIQFMHLLEQKEYELAQEKVEALRKYRVKHFNYNEGNYRTQLFIKAICTLAGSSFEKKKFSRKSTVFLEQIRKTPKGHPDQHYKIEIIPYETLLQWVYMSLEA